MKIKTEQLAPMGYTMWLSARETHGWASGYDTGARWPCSILSGHQIVVQVDQNGLCHLAVDGKEDTYHTQDGDIPDNELDALVADHLPKIYRHLWPAWEECGQSPREKRHVQGPA